MSKDEDFHQMALLLGPPPKVIWVRLGNCSTNEIERKIRNSGTVIDEFGADDGTAFMILG